MNSHLFQVLPIGTLFFRDPFNQSENPSIKVDDTHARNPRGAVVEVNGGVLVFTGTKLQSSNRPIPVVIPISIPAASQLNTRNNDFFDSLEASLEIK